VKTLEDRMTDLETKVTKLETEASSKLAATSAAPGADDALMRRVKAFMDKYASQEPEPPAPVPKQPPTPHPGPPFADLQHSGPTSPLSHSPGS
jgi:hypothetical protein